MLKSKLVACFLLLAVASPAAAQQVITYKCSRCGGFHTKVVNSPAPTTTASRVVSKPVVSEPAAAPVQARTPASSAGSTSTSATVVSGTRVVAGSQAQAPRPRWNFHNANRWRRQIDPRAQAWAQEEADRLARRAYSGYLQNGHPGGNNPYASVTGTGTTFPGASLIHTCEGSDGMTLVAEAAAVSHDGRIYGVRSWR